jgi:hypothetical protein
MFLPAGGSVAGSIYWTGDSAGLRGNLFPTELIGSRDRNAAGMLRDIGERFRS